MPHYNITLSVLGFIVKYVLKNKSDNGEFMKYYGIIWQKWMLFPDAKMTP